MSCVKEGGYNTSWLCFSFAERGWTTPQAWFLFVHQFNRSMPGLAYVEAVAIFVICFASYFTNTFTVYKFYRQKVKPEFFFLATTLCICNCVLTTNGIMLGVSRITTDWQFGISGCATFYGGSLATSTLALWVLSVISAERFLSLSGTQRPQGDIYRLTSGRIATIIGVLAITNVGLWGYVYIWLEMATTHSVSVPGYNDTVTICTIFPYRTSRSVNLHTPLVLLALCGIPLTITIINYTRILWVIRNIAKHMKKKERKCQTRGQAALMNVDRRLLLMTSRVNSVRNRGYELLLVKLMAGSLIASVISHLPFLTLLFYICGDNANAKDFETSTFTWCVTILYANAAINPFIFYCYKPDWMKRASIKVLIASWNRPLAPVYEERSTTNLSLKQLVMNNSPVVVAKNILRKHHGEILSQGVLRPLSSIV